MTVSESTPLHAVEELIATWHERGRHWAGRPFYPILLDLTGRHCLVVGAGGIGEQKIQGLVSCGANVAVVAPSATEAVRGWAAAGHIALHERAYRSADLDGCLLVIAATGDNETNRKVYEDATTRGTPCNVVDMPELCSFILPSIYRQRDLTIAVSTGGASPALARQLRLKLQSEYGEEYGLALELLGSLRKELKTRFPDPVERKTVFERIVYSDLMEWIGSGDTGKIEAWIKRCIDDGPRYVKPDEHRAMLSSWLKQDNEGE